MDVLAEGLENRFRHSDVGKLLDLVHELSDAVEALTAVDPDSANQDLPLVDDQSYEAEEEEDLDEC